MAITGKHPLMEVFGFPVDNHTKKAKHFRDNKLCPFNNKVPNCTKNSVEDPLGVCSLSESGSPTIICPIRFRQDWQIASDAAQFFFPKGTKWTTLTEVRLNDKNGKSAGNIDIVLAAMSKDGRVVDFGAVIFQEDIAFGDSEHVFPRRLKYKSREQRMNDIRTGCISKIGFGAREYWDAVSDILFKTNMLRSLGKKCATVVTQKVFDSLPPLRTASKRKAHIAWLIYELNRFRMAASTTSGSTGFKEARASWHEKWPMVLEELETVLVFLKNPHHSITIRSYLING